MDDRQRQTLQQNTIVLNVVYAESQCFPKVLRDNNVIWDLNTILCVLTQKVEILRLFWQPTFVGGKENFLQKLDGMVSIWRLDLR